MITLSFPWWYILIALPFVVLAGFPAYGQLIKVYKNFGWFLKAFYAIEVLVFGVFDVSLNVTFGTVYYLELPFIHGITLSQRTEYWCNVDDPRRGRAIRLGTQLNKIVPGHILIKQQ